MFFNVLIYVKFNLEVKGEMTFQSFEYANIQSI